MKFLFPKKAIRNISDKLRHQEHLTDEEEVIFADFREGYNDILNNYQSIIRTRLKKTKYKDVIFGQRLKRRPTIIHKLSKRFNEMDLTRMHDIAGGRIIFPNLKLLREFRHEFLKGQERSKKFRQVRAGKYDYISAPNKRTGYRGIHDVFEEITEDPIKAKIEIQYRTQVQHAWATTCEIWDSNFSDQTKFGTSDTNIQKFFKLISEFLARMLEDSSFTSTSDIEIYARILHMEENYNILSRLRGLNVLTILSRQLPKSRKLKNEMLLLTKRVKNTFVDFVIYQKIYEAMADYSLRERADPQDDNVLIKVNSRAEFKKAYNNYINDMRAFFSFLEKAREIFHHRHPIASYILEFVFPVYRQLTPKEKSILEKNKI